MLINVEPDTMSAPVLHNHPSCSVFLFGGELETQVHACHP